MKKLLTTTGLLALLAITPVMAAQPGAPTAATTVTGAIVGGIVAGPIGAAVGAAAGAGAGVSAEAIAYDGELRTGYVIPASTNVTYVDLPTTAYIKTYRGPHDLRYATLRTDAGMRQVIVRPNGEIVQIVEVP
ncbi:MAG: hypothetical protein V4691_03350 [Pseudomonadota bacterium]